MDTILELILKALDNSLGIPGSAITICDFLKNHNKTHITETFTAIRKKSKEAYDSYCEYQEYRKSEIGTPTEEKILGYWESCLERNALPSVDDMVNSDTAAKEEAEIMLPYLLKSWMGIPDFVEWLHGILAQNQMKELSETLLSLQQNLEGISAFTKELMQQDISSIAFVISPDRIVDAKCSCTDSDIKRYYMVDNRFQTMFRVISSGHDVPHTEAYQKALESVESRHPVIIAGNSGLGKTSLMMRTAIQWASSGRIAVWLSLSGKDIITEQKAEAFFHQLTASIPDGQRALLCIDNPYEGKDSFLSLQNKCPDTNKIQLIMAERANRLTSLASSDADALLYWFDNAQLLILQGLNQFRTTLELKDYDSFPFPETQKRRQKILERCTQPFVREGSLKKSENLHIIQLMLKQYSKPSVSLVELIYRTLFELQSKVSKTANIKMDWEEWADFIEDAFGKGQSYTRNELYGIIAALKIFNTPISIELFCRHFELNEHKFRNHLKERLMSQHIEPVIVQHDALQPKHDVIAELFFLFHKGKYSISPFMLCLLQSMDENDIEAFLGKIINKDDFKKEKKNNFAQIQYVDYLNEIYARMQNHTFNLSEIGRAYLCLGYLWSRFQQDTPEQKTLINNILNNTAPEIDDTHLMAILYTEWAIWARITGDDALAEENLQKVIEKNEEDVVALTELGKLWANQPHRTKDAESCFRKVIKLDKKNINARTELGMLLAKHPEGMAEAESLFREAIQIDRKNLPPHTGLGKLLARQPGRAAEAEEIFRKAMKIDSKHIPSRLELGKLLTTQPGREEDAEEVLSEVIKIDARDTQARTALVKLYTKWNKPQKAVKLCQEILKYDSKNSFARSNLNRLKTT